MSKPTKPTKTIRVGDTVKCIEPGQMRGCVRYGKHYHVIEVEAGRQRNSWAGPLIGLEGVDGPCFVWRFEKVQPKPTKKSNPKSSRRKS